MLVAKCDDVLLFTNIIGYIFIVQRLGKQSKTTCPNQALSLTQTELNLKIHGPHGPNTHAKADSQAFFSSCFKPNLLAAHSLTLLIYGDNSPFSPLLRVPQGWPPLHESSPAFPILPIPSQLRHPGFPSPSSRAYKMPARPLARVDQSAPPLTAVRSPRRGAAPPPPH